MRRFVLRHRLSWALVATLLLVALPAAAAPSSGSPWSLLVELRAWLGGGWLAKEGSMIDPDGQPRAVAPAWGEEAGSGANKEGSMIDPNGQPRAVAPGDLARSGVNLDPSG